MLILLNLCLQRLFIVATIHIQFPTLNYSKTSQLVKKNEESIYYYDKHGLIGLHGGSEKSYAGV